MHFKKHFNFNDENKTIFFTIFWIITFILYIPSAKAGWVIDASAWLYYVEHQSFFDYINRVQSHISSLYQFTQIITLIFYRIWGKNVWAWSLLYITLNAVNAYLLFLVATKLMENSNIKKSRSIAFWGVLLFIVCPHISEVLNWKACYHYLQGMLFILGGIYLTQKYQHQPKINYVLGSAALFACSIFSLEIFYLTPFFILTLAFYYRFILSYGKKIFNRTLLLFLLPQILLFICYIFLFRYFYSNEKPHVYNLLSQSFIEYFSKPPKYFFQILLFSRFYDEHLRMSIYKFIETVPAILVFYSLVIFLWVYLVIRIKKNSPTANLFLLIFTWIGFTIAILIPMPFPNIYLPVFMDRYTYFSAGFTYISIALILSSITRKFIATTILGLYGIVNIFFAIKLNIWWKQSAYTNDRLMREIPPAGDKTILLLNIPENLNGVPMIGAQPVSEFKALREILVDTLLKNQVYDIASYNKMNHKDGAHVVVEQDGSITVVLNQWGTWWWYEGQGARSYETEDFEVDMVNPGHQYRICLKKPASQFLILYENDSKWKVVNMDIKLKEQY